MIRTIKIIIDDTPEKIAEVYRMVQNEFSIYGDIDIE